MSTSPRFLIAKYIPDPQRMEPKNIGLILWSDGHIYARFIGDDDNRQATAHPPLFVKKRNYPIYEDWITYWRQLATSEFLPAERGRERVSRQSSEFLDALKLNCKENFVLVQGGFIPVPVGSQDLYRVGDELFSELVDDGKLANYEKEEARVLTASAREFVKRSGLKGRRHFSPKYKIQYEFQGVSRHVEFTYGLGGENGSQYIPQALFQTTRLSDMKDVNNALFLFEGVTQRHPQPILPPQRCASLVYGAGINGHQEVNEAIKCLDQVSVVIDVSDVDRAVEAMYQRMGLTLNGDGH